MRGSTERRGQVDPTPLGSATRVLAAIGLLAMSAAVVTLPTIIAPSPAGANPATIPGNVDHHGDRRLLGNDPERCLRRPRDDPRRCGR